MNRIVHSVAGKGKDMFGDVFALNLENVVHLDSPSDANKPLVSSSPSTPDESDGPSPKVPEVDTEKKTGVTSSDTSCITISIYSACVVALIIVCLIIGRDYVKYILTSLEKTEIWVGFLIFSVLFTVVSFPMTWGYILFNVAAGYLYGFRLGIVTVICCALFGLSLAHIIMKKCLAAYVKKKLVNDTVRAILRVIESGHGMRVVVISRLTPIPFGLQNAIFAISDIHFIRYIGASITGMAPTQGMHVYIGSTLRNMEEVLSGGSAESKSGYIVFIGQLVMVAVLLIYVIKRARRELNKTVNEYDPQQTESGDVEAPSPSSPKTQ